MRTFILFWNPAISNWKLDDCRSSIDNGDIEDFIWSVWNHKIVQYGDRFFMARWQAAEKETLVYLHAAISVPSHFLV